MNASELASSVVLTALKRHERGEGFPSPHPPKLFAIMSTARIDELAGK